VEDHFAVVLLENLRKDCEEQFGFGSQDSPDGRAERRPTLCHTLLQVWL